MKRNGGSVFPAPANTGDPNGSNRGLSANEIARALISMMARSTALQSKAGYIDARPLTASSAKSTCNARPDHTLGQSRRFWAVRGKSAYPPRATEQRTWFFDRFVLPEADSCTAAKGIHIRSPRRRGQGGTLARI